MHTMPSPQASWRRIVRATLLTLLVLIPALFTAYCVVNRDRLFPPHNAVVVYGRETCGITKMVRAGLEAKHIPYTFADINIQAIKDEMNYKLGPRFKEPSFTLPLVHVGGKLLLSPTADQIQQEVAKAGNDIERDYSTFLNGADPTPHY
jgi:glutaredoxin